MFNLFKKETTPEQSDEELLTLINFYLPIFVREQERQKNSFWKSRLWLWLNEHFFGLECWDWLLPAILVGLNVLAAIACVATIIYVSY